jgi:hypothetical protein
VFPSSPDTNIKFILHIRLHPLTNLLPSAIEIFCHRVLRDQDAYESIQADLESEDDKTRNYAAMAAQLGQKYDSTAFMPKLDNAIKDQTRLLAQPRIRDGNREEQARRRRRREAIVLNEGDRPVTQEDIIQRRRTG